MLAAVFMYSYVCMFVERARVSQVCFVLPLPTPCRCLLTVVLTHYEHVCVLVGSLLSWAEVMDIAFYSHLTRFSYHDVII